jgi:hypothetical protein
VVGADQLVRVCRPRQRGDVDRLMHTPTLTRRTIAALARESAEQQLCDVSIEGETAESLRRNTLIGVRYAPLGVRPTCVSMANRT